MARRPVSAQGLVTFVFGIGCLALLFKIYLADHPKEAAAMAKIESELEGAAIEKAAAIESMVEGAIHRKATLNFAPPEAEEARRQQRRKCSCTIRTGAARMHACRCMTWFWQRHVQVYMHVQSL